MSLFGNISNLYGTTGTTDGTTSSSSSSGPEQVVNDLAGGVLESIPFVGKLLSGIVGNLNIAENINNVLKYGFSSWGASTTPEKIKAQFAENIYPFLTGQYKTMQPENMGTILTDLYSRLTVQLQYAKKLRKHHANAGSTREALDYAIKELQKLISEGIDGLVSSLRSKGVKIQVESYNATAEQFGVVDMFDNSGTIRNGDTLGNNGAIGTAITFKRFTVDAGSVRSLEVDQNGQVKESSGGGLLALAGIGFAIFKGMK